MKIIIALLILSSFNLYADWKQDSNEGLSYFLYSPKNISTDITRPNSLMINLHGCSQKAEDLKQDGNWSAAADEYNMIVVLPKVPNGGKYMGCWDYYGVDHNRNNRDNAPLIKLVTALLVKKDLNIDPKQVYVSGLSSGGGESFVLGCLAPDLFAGIGLNAGPVIGTTSSEIGTAPSNMDSYISTCKKLAGSNLDALKTQIASIIYGNNDFIVNTKHDLMNAEVLSTIYNSKTKSTFDTKKLAGTSTDGTGTMLSDSVGPRISMIMNTNLGHNWPAGQGGNGGNFINKKSINYPLYLAKFFSENNRRTKNVYRPALRLTKYNVIDDRLSLSGEIKNNNQVTINIRHFTEPGIKLDKILSVVKNKFQFDSEVLNTKGEYEMTVSFLEEGTQKQIRRNFWIGEIPNQLKPQLFNVKFSADDQCLQVKGQAIQNGNSVITKMEYYLDQDLIGESIVDNSFFNFKSCGLKAGKHIFNAFAVNDEGISSNSFDTIFTAGLNEVTSTLYEHMAAGRLAWKDYGIWFLKYKDSAFTLYKDAKGIWSDKK